MLNLSQFSPRLARITIYPIKSFDGIALDEAQFTTRGGLVNDRRWKLIDGAGIIIDGKRRKKIHLLRAGFELDSMTVTLRDTATNAEACFHLEDELEALAAWLSKFFDTNVTILENRDGGFPDDVTRPGPTIISTATLECVAEWFGGLEVEEVRRRFRANLEVDGVPAFWEDSLFREDEADGGERFQIGDVVLEGLNPCKRCVVPTRDSRSAEELADFAVTFMQKRREAMPQWAASNRFHDFAFRLSTNTRMAELGGGIISVGALASVL